MYDRYRYLTNMELKDINKTLHTEGHYAKIMV